MSQARHQVRFPGESDAYRAARNELLEEEIALRRQVEAVAAKRRTLPLGGEVPEVYVFQEAAGDGVDVVSEEQRRDRCFLVLVVPGVLGVPSVRRQSGSRPHGQRGKRTARYQKAAPAGRPSFLRDSEGLRPKTESTPAYTRRSHRRHTGSRPYSHRSRRTGSKSGYRCRGRADSS